MRRTISTGLVLLLSLGSFNLPAANPVELDKVIAPLASKSDAVADPGNSNIVKYEFERANRLVVVMKDGSGASYRSVLDRLASAGFKPAFKSPLTNKVLTLQVSKSRLAEAYSLLEKIYEVESVEIDYDIILEPTPTTATETDPQDSLNPLTAGTFPLRNAVNVWNLDRIDQLGPQLNGQYSFTLTGQGVDVYVLDTGVRQTHTEFADIDVVKLSAFAGEFSDCDGHGTHVAATAVGRTVGVATGARLIDVKVFGGPSCSGTMSTLIAGLTYIRDNHDASRGSVVNMSLGGPFNTTVNNLVGDLHARGILSVAASGNDASNTCSTESPSSALLAITVNASTLFDGQDNAAYFSNFGPCTDIYAPGEEIYSAGHLSDYSYLELSGTSMASPLVAGVVASILEANPNASSDIISQKLLNSASPVDFLPDPSDAKKFLQFGPTLSGYFPQPAESALGFFGPGNIHATWRHPQVADDSILPVEKLGVEILTLPSSESPVIGDCSVDVSLTECTIDVSAVATSYYLRTTTETQGYLQKSTSLVEIDDYREQQKDGPWVELSVGGVTACGIDIFQDMYCWGDRVNSSTGLISPSSESDRSFVPVRVPSIGKVKFIEVAPSGSVCAITSSDRLYCWGSNLGNMVDNTNNHVSSPRDMGISNIKRVVLGNDGRACAIDLSDSLYCWGQFLGVSGNLSNPTLISTSIADVSIGSVAYCRVGLNSTQVTCAGSNHRGQLGDGTLTSSSGGTSVAGLSGTIVKLESSEDVTCALNSSAILHCWGWNDGSPDPLLASNTPRRALLISTDVEHVSLDFSSLCITQASTGRIACTGRTSHLASGLQVTGLEGNASFTYLSPTAPDSASHELGSGTICSLTIQGRILCQGSGSFGIISAGSRVTENSLSQVARVPFPVEVTKPLSSSRLQGANRYATAAQISQAAFPESGVTKVFIASGQNFPDALSAGPVAAKLDAPLLLTDPEFLIEDIRLELERLGPDEIVILGGVFAVSQAVENQLISAGWNVTRIAGANRFETSVLTSQLAFQTADTVFVATGENFPDALAGSAAASNFMSPLILLQGKSTTIIPVVASYLSDLRPSKIFVLGGQAVISDEVVSALSAYGDVERIWGADRIDTSVQIAKRIFSSAQAGIITFGWNFPDALAGSMLASKLGIPIYTSSNNCVNRGVINEFRRMGANSVYVLGGEAALSGQVAQLFPCD